MSDCMHIAVVDARLASRDVAARFIHKTAYERPSPFVCCGRPMSRQPKLKHMNIYFQATWLWPTPPQPTLARRIVAAND